MKKLAFGLISMLLFMGISQTTKAQKNKTQDKNEEIIIRKHGDKNTKITLEINDDDILINGKSLSEFEDADITLMKRDHHEDSDEGNNNFMFKQDPNEGFQFWNDDDNNRSRTFLGVTSDDNDKGVKITKVEKGSAADKAGLKEGDVITKVGDKKIEDPGDLVEVIISHKPKDEVKVYYERDGKSKDVKVILGEKKESMNRVFSFNSDNTPFINHKMIKDFNFKMPPTRVAPMQPFAEFWPSDHKRLGVNIEDAENNGGSKITNVEDGSAADKAGLKKGDIITSIDGNKVNNVDETKAAFMKLSDKDSYNLKAKRNGAESNFEIKIPKKINNADL